MTAPSFQCAILTRYLFNTLKIKIFCYSAKPYVRIGKLLKYNSDCFSFRFFYQKLIIFQIISVWCKSAIPTTLPCLFPPSIHCLLDDILSFNFCNRRQNRD